MATNKNFIVKNGLIVGGQEVISSSGVVTSAALGGQTLASTDSPTFNNLTLTNDIAVGGDLNLTGDLNITGDVNSLSVTDLDVTDQTITLGAGQVESASGGSGIIVDGSNASILWDETNDEWDFNKSINLTGTISSGAITSTGAITAKSGGGFYLQPTDAHDTDAWILYQYNDNTLRYNFTGVGADEIIIKYPNATNATTLLVDTEQKRVGIGTDNPREALEVSGNIKTDYDDSISMDYAAATGAYWKGMTGVSFDNNAARGLHIFNFDNDSNYGINFWVGTNASKVFAGRINEDAKFGIGTSSPTEKLTVNGALAITGALADDRTSTAAIDFSSGVTRFVSYGASGVGGEFAFRTASGGASSTEKMRIDDSGNVGIGTISPSTFGKLSVYGSGTAPVVAVVSGTNSPASNATYGDIAFGSRTDGTLPAFIRGIANDNTNGTDGQILFYTADNTASAAAAERMRIDSTGNVDVKTGKIKVVNSGTDAYFYEGVRDGGNVTLRMYDNNNNLYIDSYTSMALRCNQTGGGSGGQIFLTGGDVNIGSSSDSARYLIFDKTISGESGILFRNASNNKGKILLNSNEQLKFYVNNTTDAMTINEVSDGGATTVPGVQIGNLSHGWGNLVVTSDDSSYDGGITIAAASTTGGTAGYGALFWKQGGIAADNTKWFMGLTNSTSGGAAYDDMLLGAYNLNTGYSRGGRTDGVMHFDRSNGDVHVAKQVNFHGQQGFKVYNTSGFSKSANWQNISGSITTVDYNNGGWSSSTGRFQPTKAGYYLFTFGGWATANSDGNRYATCFSKNTTGQRYISGADYCALDSPMNGHSEIIYMNGSTDYVDLYAYSSISTTWGGTSHAVWWGAEFLH